MADGSELKHFVDFTNILVKKKKLSSATVSRRLDELVTADAIEEVIARSSTGRRIIAYKTTEKGKKVMAHMKELEEALVSSKSR